MTLCQIKTLCITIIFFVMASNFGCQRTSHQTSIPVIESFAPPVKKPARGDEPTMVSVGFLEDRIKNDPDDIIALNKLSGYYLQLHQETDDLNYLELALQAAQASLRVFPADQNLGGLRALAQAELATHNFMSARRHAVELTEYEPQSSFGFQVLGDASIELGDYEAAAKSYRRMEELDGGSFSTLTRLAHLDLLRGNITSARSRYEAALNQARSSNLGAEITAWCYWRLGEVELSLGQAEKAETYYRKALAVLEDYPEALASLARLRAGRGDRHRAIDMLEKAVALHPNPADIAALGDLYQMAGREKDAAAQYSAVERLSQQSGLHTALFSRHLALFWADHDRNPEEAYELARKEYETRPDVYGADVLAWASLKSGRIEEAQTAIEKALRLGTQDARLFYHAGMIARAAGDSASARRYLQQALKLNPYFDPLQSLNAAKALEETRKLAAR